MAIAWHALGQKVKGQGHTVMKTIKVASEVCCCCCRHGTACHMTA